MRIICVHQGYELYGSDRSFIESVAAIREGWPAADIEVVLSGDGPIVAPLRKIASHVIFEPIWVLRRRSIMNFAVSGLFRFFPAIWRAIRRIRSADLVYVNTIVIFDYLLAARFFGGKVLVHVHEIPEGLATRFFRSLLRWSRAELIFNSKATKRAFALPATFAQHVVYNAIAGPTTVHVVHYDGSRPLRFLMIGRINRIKGQDILIEALASLPSSIRERLEVRIVGGTFQNDAMREQSLRFAAQSADLAGIVRFEPFQDDPAPLYDWADIVLAPSRRPESLGRVAIEGMAHGRPTIASEVGGLAEVVEDGATGWLVAPNDPAGLASKIAEAVTRPELWRTYPAAARARYEAVFGNRAITQQLQAIVRARLGQSTDAQQGSDLVRI